MSSGLSAFNPPQSPWANPTTQRSGCDSSFLPFSNIHVHRNTRLCDHGAGGGGLVLPVGLQNTNGLVVSAETVDSGFDKNETELGVLVLSVALEMLADGDGLKVSINTMNSRLVHQCCSCLPS